MALQLIHGMDGGIRRVSSERGFAAQPVQGGDDVRNVVAATGEEDRESFFLDAMVVSVLGPVAERRVTQRAGDWLDHPVAGGAFGFGDAAHAALLEHKRMLCGEIGAVGSIVSQR
jgi:hypothetical protein